MLLPLGDALIDPYNLEFLCPDIEKTLKCDHIYMTVKKLEVIKFDDFFNVSFPFQNFLDIDMYIYVKRTYCIRCLLQNTTFTYQY
jgi:hypothetical protein